MVTLQPFCSDVVSADKSLQYKHTTGKSMYAFEAILLLLSPQYKCTLNRQTPLFSLILLAWLGSLALDDGYLFFQ